MPCDLETTQLAACESGIGKLDNPISLLQIIAQLSCEIADVGGGGGGTPGGAANSVQFNDAGAFGGFGSFNSGTNVLTIPGDLLFNTNNTDDIGASGGNMPRTGYFGTSVVTPFLDVFSGAIVADSPAIEVTQTWNNAGVNFTGVSLNIVDTASAAASILMLMTVGGANRFLVTKAGNVTIAGSYTLGAGGIIQWAARTMLASFADGNLIMLNAAQTGFGLLQFGGAGATFPALKRSATTLQVRLSDDSAFGTIQGIHQVSVNATASGAVVNTHTIPITDASGTVYRVLCLV